jgi:hypothetical protein
MSVDAVIARAERNNLAKLAGSAFRDPNADIIAELKARNFDAVLGLENEQGQFTVLAMEGIIVKNAVGAEHVIPFNDAILPLQKNAMAMGKGGSFEYVQFGEFGEVWMKDGPTMCAIWNIAMMMQKWGA